MNGSSGAYKYARSDEFVTVPPLGGKLEDAVVVLSRSEAEEEGGFFLTVKFRNGPLFAYGLLLVKAAFQRIINAEQFDMVRPAQ
jgi:hypothetical protein